MSLSFYMKNYLVEAFFTGSANLDSPLKDKQAYLALYTGPATTPSTDEAYVEVSGTGYSRVAVNLVIKPGAVITNNTYATNDYTINFPTSSGVWGTVLYLGLTDASSGGNLIFITPLTAPTYVGTGKVFRLNPYNLYFSMENHPWTGYWETIKPGGWSVDYSLQTINWIINPNPPTSTTFPYQSDYYVALGRSVVADAINRFVSWTECSGGGYARQWMSANITEGGPNWQKESYTGQATNIDVISWGPATSNWGDITDVLLLSSPTNTPAFWAHLGATKTINSGEGFSIPVGQLFTYFESQS